MGGVGGRNQLASFFPIVSLFLCRNDNSSLLALTYFMISTIYFMYLYPFQPFVEKFPEVDEGGGDQVGKKPKVVPRPPPPPPPNPQGALW